MISNGQNKTRQSNSFETTGEMIGLWESVISEAHNLKNKDNIIIGVAVLSSLLVLILVYLIVIRPYLKRKAEASTEEPIDTSRAPMDLTFRPPVRKQNRLKACCFCTP